MFIDKNIELFKKFFIDNQSSIDDLILIKGSLIEFRDQELEKVFAEYIDEKISILKK